MKPIKDSLISDPPCIGCEHTDRCELDELACRTFAQYAEYNRFEKDSARFPDKKTYIRIFADDDGQAKLL